MAHKVHGQLFAVVDAVKRLAVFWQSEGGKRRLQTIGAKSASFARCNLRRLHLRSPSRGFLRPSTDGDCRAKIAALKFAGDNGARTLPRLSRVCITTDDPQRRKNTRN
jgi:fermentation-respiration switch protein FrsA (DUF1100 family)